MLTVVSEDSDWLAKWSKRQPTKKITIISYESYTKSKEQTRTHNDAAKKFK